MRHPTEGVLRRLIDEPAGVSDPDRRHVADCAQCLSALAATRADAVAVGAALQPAAGSDADVPAAWQRLNAALPTAAPAAAAFTPARPARGPRARGLLRRPAVAVAAAALVLAGAGTAAANDWLPIFRTEQIAPVSLTAADLVSLPDLSAYGDLEVSGEPDLREVPDAAAATSATGLDLPQVAFLPDGVVGRPEFQVGDQVSATFTYSAARAAQAASEAGETAPPSPPGLDGSQVRMVAGPGVAQVWSSSSGLPALVVGTAVAPTAFSSGVPFETLRDHLLSLPGIPAELAAQLRTFTADGATLPLPVPGDEVETSTADVGGVQATVLASRDQSMAAVVWVEDGVVTAVAGSLGTDELLSVARELR
ncbi:hypothetical protein GB931_04560 [Modestobacter sp. I12A-02628]|uniref:DUF4367 domain-containing protein n=1 Tax=Goekera deserti TaxID=2497753 RepID=A0A7K3WDW2_9ACTN|nr:hypothetical protein [Goekera deserti]MPQ97210.1 hypothetical protein [Goekera deserti]NDI46472.1 hypothetical protein [Goekera deserti]NEL54594.1 hypothetical protein [Goekera deserti]